MKEKTSQKRRGKVITDQETVTGGVRLYGTHVRKLEEATALGKGVYRFVLKIPYKNPRTVKGALTCTVAEWESLKPNSRFRVGCYVHKFFFKPGKAVIDILIVAENARVIAINIEGRIVDAPKLTL